MTGSIDINNNFLKGSNLLNSKRIYYVKYDNVEGLAPSAPVTINGLQVGKVQTVLGHVASRSTGMCPGRAMRCVRGKRRTGRRVAAPSSDAAAQSQTPCAQNFTITDKTITTMNSVGSSFIIR